MGFFFSIHQRRAPKPVGQILKRLCEYQMGGAARRSVFLDEIVLADRVKIACVKGRFRFAIRIPKRADAGRSRRAFDPNSEVSPRAFADHAEYPRMDEASTSTVRAAPTSRLACSRAA